MAAHSYLFTPLYWTLSLSSLQNRKTSRDFSRSQPLSMEKVSTILFASFGYLHGKEWDEFKEKSFVQFGFRRSSPSIGSLQPCDAFVVVFNVDGMENGVFFYDMDTHSLAKVENSFTDNDLYHSVCDQFWVNGIGLGIFITTDMQRIWSKYPDARSFAISYAEVGHFSQTTQLCATAIGYKTWITGVFRDDFVSQKLNLPPHIFPAFFIGIGMGSGSAIPADFL